MLPALRSASDPLSGASGRRLAASCLSFPSRDVELGLLTPPLIVGGALDAPGALWKGRCLPRNATCRRASRRNEPSSSRGCLYKTELSASLSSFPPSRCVAIISNPRERESEPFRWPAGSCGNGCPSLETAPRGGGPPRGGPSLGEARARPGCARRGPRSPWGRGCGARRPRRALACVRGVTGARTRRPAHLPRVRLLCRRGSRAFPRRPVVMVEMSGDGASQRFVFFFKGEPVGIPRPPGRQGRKCDRKEAGAEEKPS